MLRRQTPDRELKKGQTNRSDKEDSGNYPREEENAVCTKVRLKRQDEAFMKAGRFVE